MSQGSARRKSALLIIYFDFSTSSGKPYTENNTSQDPINENKWFKRDIIYPEDKRTE